MAAMCAAYSSHIEMDAIVEGIESVPGVPGRFEVIRGSSGVIAVIDYAHTPDALEKVLKDLRRIHRGRIITVFGCGGDRDRGKRSEMGGVAGQLSDFTIVTSDNPRTENPRKIIEDILPGIPPSSSYEVIYDREEAICEALGKASEGDIVLIAGKGHEDYQIIGDRVIHFDDGSIARAFFSKE
jgi:UDP-N-acetylmuramoyl-L-alanyl-D-glutamate--2,6-diaminopimelate ligase